MSTPTPPEGDQPRVLPRPFTIVAAVAMIAVLGIATFVACDLAGDDAPGPDASAEPTATASPSTDAAAPAEPLQAAPADVEWVVEHGVMLPASEVHGPAEVTEAGVPTGFAHTPSGALLAAVQYLGRGSTTFDAASRRALVTACFVAGPDADAMLASIDDGEVDSSADLAVVAAFAQHSYSDTESVIELVMDAGQGRYISFMVTIVWDEASAAWRIVPPAGGDWSVAARTLTSLDGVITWGP